MGGSYPILFLVISILVVHGEARPPQEERPTSLHPLLSGLSRKIDPNKIYILRRKTPKTKVKTETAIEDISLAQQDVLVDRSSEERMPIMVDTSSANNFRGNIHLPMNPFMSPPAVTAPQPQRTIIRDDLNVYVEKPHKTADSRADTFSPFSSLFSLIKSRAKLPYSHYTKPGSSHITRGGEYIPQESRRSSVKFKVPLISSRETFATLLTQMKNMEQLKEAFPPPGSYTPYGERTIIMIKYPGLPERKRNHRVPLDVGSFGNHIFKIGGIKTISLPQDNWGSSGDRPLKLMDSDFGVIISQNYVLQPDISMNSPYNRDHHGHHETGQNPADLVSQLAKALAERNKIINSYNHLGKELDKQAPFVLVHLETYTKKTNKTTNFGFDEDLETNYANGTIIYPTLHDPSVLASTKFEFDNIQDIDNIFDRPFQAYHEGAMKPVVPLGMVDIQNYLRLLYEVHKDIHESGKGKVDELKGLSYVVEKQTLPGARPMVEWEVKGRDGKYNNNWLHTSTIGLRSLSDYPPPPPQLPVPYPLSASTGFV